MTTEQQIAVVPPKETALQVYSAANGLDPYLDKIRAEIDGFTPDVTTKKGRDAIASIAYKVARSKTALDGVGKDLVAELKEVPKKIDAERKRMRDQLDAWQAEVRRPLTEWEDAEKARVENLEARVQQLREFVIVDGLAAAGIQVQIDNLEAISIGADWEEFEPEAHRVKASSRAALREALVARNKYEAEQAELERLRIEAAQREQKERAEQEAQARAERAAAQERQRQADEQARAEAEAKAREADKAHKKQINNEALAALIAGGMPEDCAKQAITLIAQRKIPHISISY